MKFDKIKDLQKSIVLTETRLAALYKQCRKWSKGAIQDGSAGACWHYEGGDALLTKREDLLAQLSEENGEELSYYSVSVELDAKYENSGTVTHSNILAPSYGQAQNYITRMHYPNAIITEGNYTFKTKLEGK